MTAMSGTSEIGRADVVEPQERRPGTRDTHAGLGALAWGLGGACALGWFSLAAVALLHDGADAFGQVASGLPLVLMFATTGTLLALRQPANPIGWLLASAGLIWLSNDAAQYLVTSRLESGEKLGSALALVAVYDEWIWPAGVLFSVGLPLLLFPDGRLRSRRWRWMLAATGGGTAVTLGSAALSTAPIPNHVDPSAPIDNPWGVAALSGLTRAGLEDAPVVVVGLMTVALAALLLRSRTAGGNERQQLRWVGSGALMALAGILVFPIGDASDLPDGVVRVAFTLGFACLPLSITVAILRYRLYDLDRVVSRTVTYGAVTGLLIAVYAGLVTAVSRLTPSGSSLAVASSTLAVAALFQPLRRRVQLAVDRRFNRARYDADFTVDAFSRRLREHVELSAVRAELLAVTHQTLQPASAALWLRDTTKVHP